jgi:predicted GIY-YIG superfamily endonuclease
VIWLAVAAGGFLALVGWDLASQWLARDALRSSHVVYFLVGDSPDRVAGTVLYVGSTNNYRRRLAEHCADDEPAEWRRRIRGIVVVRYCWSSRQARRVERRMIRAIQDGARWRMCAPLNNVLLVGGSLLSSPSRLVWLLTYRVNGVLWPWTRWHGVHPAAAWNKTVDVNQTVLEEPLGGGDTMESPVEDHVIGDDTLSETPLGVLNAADPVISSDTDDQPPTPPPPEDPTLRLVPEPVGDDLPSDPLARKRERDRRNKRAQRERERAQNREAG